MMLKCGVPKCLLSEISVSYIPIFYKWLPDATNTVNQSSPHFQSYNQERSKEDPLMVKCGVTKWLLLGITPSYSSIVHKHASDNPDIVIQTTLPIPKYRINPNSGSCAVFSSCTFLSWCHYTGFHNLLHVCGVCMISANGVSVSQPTCS